MKTFVILLLTLFVTSAFGAGDTTRYTILSAGKVSGKQLMWSDGPGQVSYYFEYNDRGRGPKLRVDLGLDTHQIISRKVTGVDYFKGPVEETFQVVNNVASWKNNIEQGQKQATGPVVYSALNGVPGEIEWDLKLLMHHRVLELDQVPSGKLKIEHEKSHTAKVNGFPEELELYSVSGSGGPPSYVWMTPKHDFFASVSGWMSVIKLGYEFLVPELKKVQDGVEDDFYEGQVIQLTQTPKTPVAITNVSVFNSKTGKVMTGQTIVMENGKITMLGKSSSVKVPAQARVIDGAGKMALPGLWDNHTHFQRSTGLFHLAAGVTNIKDMANDFDLPSMREEVKLNQQLGPDISVISGFIDFAGPYAGPTGKIVKTLDEGLDAVNFYADKGYDQIKLYSSIPPDWVSLLAAQAHRRGMKVVGHVPSGMTAQRAIESGYDQVIHMNMIMLNFMGDTLDTRSMGRFTKVGERAGDINMSSPQVKQFIQLLKSRHTVVDPTMAIFEQMFTHQPGQLAPGYGTVEQMLPPSFRRSLLQGGLPAMKGKEDRYARSFARMQEMLKLLYKNKIEFVPGTDDMAGFTLHRELELYAAAGVPNAQVLQKATIRSAEVAGKANDLGVIEVGKRSNIILVEGNPVERISDIRKVVLTVKGPYLYDPKALYASYGFGFWK